MSNINRVFCNVEMDQFFPLASIRALPRLGSDHTLILWESGCGIAPKPAKENWWLMRDELMQLPKENWSKPAKGSIAHLAREFRRFRN
jgi:hypothetical protein